MSSLNLTFSTKRLEELLELPLPKSPRSETSSLNSNDLQDFLFDFSTPAASSPSQPPLVAQHKTVFSRRELKVLNLFLDFLNAPEGEPLGPKIEKLKQANHEADLPDSPPPQRPVQPLPF